MIRKLGKPVLMGLSLWTAGCAMEFTTPEETAVTQEGDPAAGDVETSEAELKSSKPKPTDYPGAVFLKRIGNTGDQCSGALVAPDAIMTAAHCLTGAVPIDGAFIRVWAEAMVNGSRKCITAIATNVAQCDTSDTAHSTQVWAQYAETYQGNGDTMSDVGVVALNWSRYSQHNFQGLNPSTTCSYAQREGANKPSCYFRIYTGTFAATRNMTMYGFGKPTAQVGTLNVGYSVVDWYGEHHFLRETQTSDQERLCKGDSGGPAAGDKIALNTPYEMLLGVASNADEVGSDGCAKAGSRERWNRSSTKVWLVEEVMRVARHDADFSCAPYTTADGYQYEKCW